ncbi:hypothetical protein ACWA5Z_04705 [Testudinibacter sp. P80/BLE/0925]|uniref:hypothetical protein n=1 Tax=Testudinibacter sp. TW-1 TaxID=3417757 RepID=UPI003D36B821
MKRSLLLTTVMLCFTLAGCQQMLEASRSMRAALENINTGLSGAYVEQTTQNSIDSTLNNAKPNSAVKALFNDAKPTMNKVLGLLACLPDGSHSNSQLMIYSDPDSIEPHSRVKPQSNMSYHKSGCLNVSRVIGFKKLAANTFEFKVYFTSRQSGETVNKRYHAIKQPGGEWLFDFWGL